MLDNLGYRHTLRICNAYTFSMATVVKRTGFIVTCIRTLPVIFKIQAYRVEGRAVCCTRLVF